MAAGPTFSLRSPHSQGTLHDSAGAPKTRGAGGRFVKRDNGTWGPATGEADPTGIEPPAPVEDVSDSDTDPVAAALRAALDAKQAESRHVREVRADLERVRTELVKLQESYRDVHGGIHTLADLTGKADKGFAESIAAVEARMKAVEDTTVKTIRFQVGEAVGPEIKGARPELAAIVRRILAGRRNVWMTGPAGSGKTSLAAQVAEALGRRFGAQSFAPDITTGALVGGVDVSGTWKETAFVDFYENGGVYLLDEIDAADAAILVYLNAALENGTLYLPRHNDPARRIIKRHPETVIIGAANTWGTGADAQYVGRSQLDAAFLSRFALAKFGIGYDEKLEASLCPDRALLSELHAIRGRLQDNKIRRLCGTREIKAAGELFAAGFTQAEIIEALCTDWTEAEKAKAIR